MILSHATHLYLDHPYEPDFDEPGLYWAASYIDTRKVFEYLVPTWRSAANGSQLRRSICDQYWIEDCSQPVKLDNIVGWQLIHCLLLRFDTAPRDFRASYGSRTGSPIRVTRLVWAPEF